VPMIEGCTDLFCGNRIGLLQVVERGVGKDHTPAKGIVRPVAFDNGDLVAGVMQFHQQAEIQACRTAAYAYDVHVVSGYSTFPAMRTMRSGLAQIFFRLKLYR